MSPGSCARVRRVLLNAGLRSMWADMNSGAWGVELRDRMYVVSDAEDPDRPVDPRDVAFKSYVLASDGDWNDVSDEPETTLRDVLARLRDMKRQRNT